MVQVVPPQRLRLAELYAELGVDPAHKHTKVLTLGDQARLMQLQEERAEKRRERERLRDLQPSPPQPKAAALEALRFQIHKVGHISCGLRGLRTGNAAVPTTDSAREGTAAIAGNKPAVASPPKLLEATKAATPPRPTELAIPFAAPAARRAERKAVTATEEAEKYERPAADVDGEPGRWRRVAGERYVDVYLNGGKFDPPAKYLSEESQSPPPTPPPTQPENDFVIHTLQRA